MRFLTAVWKFLKWSTVGSLDVAAVFSVPHAFMTSCVRDLTVGDIERVCTIILVATIATVIAVESGRNRVVSDMAHDRRRPGATRQKLTNMHRRFGELKPELFANIFWFSLGVTLVAVAPKTRLGDVLSSLGFILVVMRAVYCGMRKAGVAKGPRPGGVPLRKRLGDILVWCLLFVAAAAVTYSFFPTSLVFVLIIAVSLMAAMGARRPMPGVATEDAHGRVRISNSDIKLGPYEVNEE